MAKFNANTIEVITDTNGSVRHYKGGKLHREDGPAVINVNGNDSWYYNGKLHRTDGPAIDPPNTTHRWFIDGVRMTSTAEFQQEARLTDDQVASIVALYGEVC